MVTLRTGDRCLFENPQDEVFRLQGEGYEEVMKANAVVIMHGQSLSPSFQSFQSESPNPFV